MPNNELPLLEEWNHLHLTPVWAYRGKPQMAWQASGITPGATGWLLERGKVEIQMGSNRLVARAGQWVLVPRGALRFRFSDDATIVSIHYVAQWIGGTPLFEHDTPLVVEARDHPALCSAGLALQRFVEQRFPTAGTKLLHQRGDFRTHLRLQTLSIRWMSAVNGVMESLKREPTSNKPMDPRVIEARKIIDIQLATQPFVERELPKRLSISASHLDRLFLKELGITPRLYADKARLNVACHLLVTGPMMSKQIAFRLGFAQPSHFTRWFRSHTNATPQAYRKQFRRTGKSEMDAVTPTFLMSSEKAARR